MIGAYTTFSTWMLETHRLAEDRELSRALLNLGLSLIAGIGTAAVGRLIGAHAVVRHHRRADRRVRARHQ